MGAGADVDDCVDVLVVGANLLGTEETEVIVAGVSDEVIEVTIDSENGLDAEYKVFFPAIFRMMSPINTTGESNRLSTEVTTA